MTQGPGRAGTEGWGEGALGRRWCKAKGGAGQGNAVEQGAGGMAAAGAGTGSGVVQVHVAGWKPAPGRAGQRDWYHFAPAPPCPFCILTPVFPPPYTCACAAPFQKEVMKFRDNEANILRKQAVWQVRTQGGSTALRGGGQDTNIIMRLHCKVMRMRCCNVGSRRGTRAEV